MTLRMHGSGTGSGCRLHALLFRCVYWTGTYIHSDHAYMYTHACTPRIMHHGAFILISALLICSCKCICLFLTCILDWLHISIHSLEHQYLRFVIDILIFFFYSFFYSPWYLLSNVMSFVPRVPTLILSLPCGCVWKIQTALRLRRWTTWHQRSEVS